MVGWLGKGVVGWLGPGEVHYLVNRGGWVIGVRVSGLVHRGGG